MSNIKYKIQNAKFVMKPSGLTKIHCTDEVTLDYTDADQTLSPSRRPTGLSFCISST